MIDNIKITPIIEEYFKFLGNTKVSTKSEDEELIDTSIVNLYNIVWLFQVYKEISLKSKHKKYIYIKYKNEFNSTIYLRFLNADYSIMNICDIKSGDIKCDAGVLQSQFGNIIYHTLKEPFKICEILPYTIKASSKKTFDKINKNYINEYE